MKSKLQIKKELAEQYFGEEAREYDKVRVEDPRRTAVIKIQKKITRDFLRYAGKKNILDIACGTGRFFYLYAPREIYGMDISKAMLKEAKKRKGVKIKKLLVADAEKIPFKDNMFDVVITSQFIMHTPFYKNIIREMTRVAKKGGSLIIDFPNKYSISYFFTKARVKKGVFRYYNLFTRKEIYEIAKENNLKINTIKGTVVFSPMLFPKSLANFSMKLNTFLIKFLSSFSYVYYVHLVKQ